MVLLKLYLWLYWFYLTEELVPNPSGVIDGIKRLYDAYDLQIRKKTNVPTDLENIFTNIILFFTNLLYDSDVERMISVTCNLRLRYV